MDVISIMCAQSAEDYFEKIESLAEDGNDVIFHVTAKLLIVLEFGEEKHVVFNMGNVESTKDFYKKLKGKARLL